jgi:IclR family acetate operon transcriptional repressor
VAVKRSRSATRAFSVFEIISAQQPIGVGAAAKLLDEDKSAVQRAVATLADAGWIQPSPLAPGRWELSPHIFRIAHLPHSAQDLRQRARQTLDDLRDRTGESAFLAVLDGDRFVIIEVADSPQALRMVIRIGESVPARGSATGRAVLPFLSPEQRQAMLGGPPDADDAVHLAASREQGYGLSLGEVQQGSINIAAPVFDRDGAPIAAVGVSGPSDRVTPDRHAALGGLAAQAARGLSRNARRQHRGGARPDPEH